MRGLYRLYKWVIWKDFVPKSMSIFPTLAVDLIQTSPLFSKQKSLIIMATTPQLLPPAGITLGKDLPFHWHISTLHVSYQSQVLCKWKLSLPWSWSKPNKLPFLTLSTQKLTAMDHQSILTEFRKTKTSKKTHHNYSTRSFQDGSKDKWSPPTARIFRRVGAIIWQEWWLTLTTKENVELR